MSTWKANKQHGDNGDDVGMTRTAIGGAQAGTMDTITYFELGDNWNYDAFEQCESDCQRSKHIATKPTTTAPDHAPLSPSYQRNGQLEL